MALSENTKERMRIALTDATAGNQLANKVDQASHDIVAMSTSATISTDTAFIAKLKIGDLVVSHKAAANQNAPVIANATLPGGITDAAGVTLAYRAAL